MPLCTSFTPKRHSPLSTSGNMEADRQNKVLIDHHSSQSRHPQLIKFNTDIFIYDSNLKMLYWKAKLKERAMIGTARVIWMLNEEDILLLVYVYILNIFEEIIQVDVRYHFCFERNGYTWGITKEKKSTAYPFNMRNLIGWLIDSSTANIEKLFHASILRPVDYWPAQIHIELMNPLIRTVKNRESNDQLSTFRVSYPC